MRRALAVLLAAGMAAAVPDPAPAQDGVEHATPAEAATHAAAGPALPFPIEIRPRFGLVDHSGRTVSEADFAGQPMLIFFGYASCESICPVALERVGAALDLLGAAGAEVAALMITVDPARDAPEAMAARLAEHHPRLVGLTGSAAALAEARAAFQVEVTPVAETAEGVPVYAHGSFLYLVGRDGVVKSVLPPVLAPERIAALVRQHL